MHIQNTAIFRILAYIEPNIYSELCQGIFWHVKNAALHSHIKNPATFRILKHLGPSKFRILFKTHSGWYGKPRVTNCELRVTSFKAYKHELNLKSASSNPRVTSSNPWVTSSNPQVTSSSSLVASPNPWVTSSNLWVTSLNPRVTS